MSMFKANLSKLVHIKTWPRSITQGGAGDGTKVTTELPVYIGNAGERQYIDGAFLQIEGYGAPWPGDLNCAVNLVTAAGSYDLGTVTVTAADAPQTLDIPDEYLRKPDDDFGGNLLDHATLEVTPTFAGGSGETVDVVFIVAVGLYNPIK